MHAHYLNIIYTLNVLIYVQKLRTLYTHIIHIQYRTFFRYSPSRTQDTDTGTIETLAQTPPKAKSDEIPIQTQSQPINLNIVSTGTLSVDEKRHLGVAVPVTMEEIEKELASQSSVRETSTSKDGISTWILLSGTSPTAAPEMSRSGAEIQKVDKTTKIRDNSKAPNKAAVKSNQNNKNKPKSKTTTPLPSVTNETNSELNVSKIEILPDPVPLAQTPILRPKKRPTTTTVATTPQTPEEVTVTEGVDDIIATTKETPVPFLVLEPKDADFDLPQDRSPGKTTTKKPKRNNNKTKKKNNKKPNNNNNNLNDTKNSTKTAIKKKENPIGTKIYNYLSREMMPAVGLLGLVLTAGLAGYFVGPFGALRRSYDINDRKDDLYYHNNEEYAGTDGQYEEEVFGKVIAGMPLNSNYRNNVRYNNHRPNYYHQGPSKYPQQYNNRYRNAANQQLPHQQHVAQQLSYSGYHPNTQNNAANYQRIHHTVPTSQNVVIQKSISNPIFAIQPSATSTTVKSTTTIPATVVHDINKLPNQNVEDAFQSAMEDNPNELKKRTQFVVGSVLPETNVMDMNNDQDKSVVVPEHGPRRRRRSIETTASSRKGAESDVKKLENSYDQLKKRVDSAGEKNEQILKELKHIDYEIGRLRKVIAEIKDIEQFQDELHIKGKNRILSDTIMNGVVHITEGIKFVNELLDNPTEIDSKIANRESMKRTVNGEKQLNVTAQMKSDVATSDTFEPSTEAPTGIMSLLKILELKAAFGVNVLRSIRPAFDRAFQDVFNTPSHESESA